MAPVVVISAGPACSSLQPSLIRGASQRRSPNLLITRFLGERLALAVSDEVACCRSDQNPRIAEGLTFGKENVTTGASTDFRQVSRVARQMVERCGFSKRNGHLSLGGGGGNGEYPTGSKTDSRSVVVARCSSNGNGSGGDSDGLLSGKEFFDSFLRRRQAADGNFASKAADVVRGTEVVELDEESRQRVREKLSQLQKLKEVNDSGSFLKLSQARSWSLGQDATPANANSPALDRERAREDRRKQSLLEYEALKRELSSMTLKVSVAASAYCLLILSPEAMVSYSIGAISRIGITSADLQESLEKLIRGSSRALSSPRLAIPSALFGLWGLTEHFVGNSPFHLQVVPLLFGFFAYKAAALVQTYEENKDFFSMLADPKGSEDR